MVLQSLIGLGEGVVVGLAGSVVPEATEVGLHVDLLLDFDGDALDLK